MKLSVTISGQDATRLADRVDQFVRNRTGHIVPQAEDDVAASPSSTRHRPPLDRRS